MQSSSGNNCQEKPIFFMFLSEIFLDQPKSAVRDHVKYILRFYSLHIHSQILQALWFTYTHAPSHAFSSLHEVIRRTQYEPK